MISRAARLAWLAVLAAAAARDLAAQEVPRVRLLPVREEIAQEAADARFHLGPLRLLPTLSFQNAGWTNNVLGTEPKTPDYLATVVGGTRFVLPMGPDVYLRGDVLPSYTWYAHLVERRSWGGTYGAELAVFRGRFTLLAGGGYERSTAFASSEILEPARITTVTGHAALEIEIFRRLSLVGSGDGQQTRYAQPPGSDQAFSLLDVDQRAVRGGLKYRFRDRFDLTAQVEGTRSTFPNEGAFRDNQTTAYLGSIGYDRPRFYVNLAAGYRKGRAYQGSAFPEYGGATGSFFVSWFLVRPLELQAYGKRDLVSSLFVGNPYFVETLGGAAVNLHVGHRLVLTGFGELSRLRYPNVVEGASEARRDNGTTYGGGFTLLVFRSISLATRVTKTEYTSNVPGADRSILAVSTNLAYDVFQPRSR